MKNLIKNRWLPFEEAHKVVLKEAKKWGVLSKRKWRNYSKIHRPYNIPSVPSSVYKEWKGWNHWLGTEDNSNFLSFDEALRIARKDVNKYNIVTWNDWNLYCKSGNKPNDIPSCPDSVYKNKGWINWGQWLDNSKKKKEKKRERWPSFKNAVKEARRLSVDNNVKGYNDWVNFRKSDLKPSHIPACPNVIYKNRGWVNWMHWLGVEKKKNSRRKYKVNDDYFKKWSHNMSYVLGFWFADGYVCKRKRKNVYSFLFSIGQHIRDKYLIELFLTDMESDNPILIHSSGDFVSFSITSEGIYNDILRKGGSPRKSNVIRLPNVPKKYLFDFIRGYFDGDGCIYKLKNKKVYRASIVSGSKGFIFDLKEAIERNIKNTKLSVDFRSRESGSAYRLRFNVKDTIKLGEYMYEKTDKRSLKLNRKYEKFKKSGVNA